MAESRDRLLRSNAVTTSFGNRRQAANGFSVFQDEAEAGFVTPFRRGATPLTRVTRGSLGTAATRGRGGDVGRGNGRDGGSLLPSWYPRAPLRDITAIIRAIERRTAHGLREAEEDPQTNSPVPPEGQVPNEHALGSQLEHNLRLNHNKGEDDCLTHQQPRKLVNNIYSMEIAILEEMRTVMNTPSAKKAERAKKMKTLMSMR